MAALAFWLFLLFLLGVGVCFIVVGICGKIVIKKVAKLWVILIVLGIIICAIPVGWLSFFRITNGIPESDYIDTGTEVFWEDGHTFTYNNTKYIKLEPGGTGDDIFYYDIYGEDLGTAEFNIRKKGGFFNILFNDYEQNVVYKINNRAGVTLYYVDCELFCSSEDKEKAEKFYMDDNNYSWFYETDEERFALVLSETEISILKNLKESVNQQEIAADTYSMIEKESLDGVVSAYMYIAAADGSWYWDSEECVFDESEEPTEKIFGYKLPESVNEKINNL